MAGVHDIIVNFVIVYLPPMVANGTPVVVMKNRKGRPLDRGVVWLDGRRLLGDGKTLEGTATYILGGIIASIIIACILGGPREKIVLTGFVASLGGAIGDIVESFVKRRLGLKRGEPLILADQLDFYLGATLFVLLCGKCIKPLPESFVLGLILVPLLHVATNRLAYYVRIKSVPW